MKDVHRILGLAVMLGTAVGAAQEKSACPNCMPTEERRQAIVEEFAADIHGQKGMTCALCHGDGRIAEFHDIPRERIPGLCGSCHANVTRMKHTNPSLRTDQLAQYSTSVHGMKFAKGDMRVAVCTDCHSAHAIRPASDPRSTVHPKNEAATCKRCHADAEYMKAYHVAIDQFAGYTESVHHQAMVERGDLSVPTCSSCHGSHGAVPPGATSAASVCGTCHVLQAKAFTESPHKKMFELMGLGGCVACHSSHRIRRPDDTFVGTGPKAVCSTCHSSDDVAGQTANIIHARFQRLEGDIANTRALLTRAERAGMDVADAQFELSKAGEELTQARVVLHTATLTRVMEDVDDGDEIVAKARAAAEAALKERDRRRKTVVVPLIAILALLATLRAYVRNLERSEPILDGVKQ